MSPVLTQKLAQCQGHTMRSPAKDPAASGAPKCVHCKSHDHTNPLTDATTHGVTGESVVGIPSPLCTHLVAGGVERPISLRA